MQKWMCQAETSATSVVVIPIDVMIFCERKFMQLLEITLTQGAISS
ncbi:hypothetical protein [Calothrix sp. 336/3]|nr:hypothetical protein [Calothrix sp. 336/3]